MVPPPTSVPYNDWRQVEAEPLETFTPTLPVSVVLPAYRTPAATLARTLAALEGQTYPRDLWEVVLVDDGSQPPLERPRSAALDVRVVRQERRGFGLARARNTGAGAAAGDILLFLDSDMLVEADWMAAHARWHHAVCDALTLGDVVYVAVDGLAAETIRGRSGALRELFADRPAGPREVEDLLLRTRALTTRADDVFRAMRGGNFGVGQSFYRLVGGMDESFTRWGAEDTEFSYRAYARGGLLVPVREASAWHQGRWEEGRDAKERSRRIQQGKAAHLIASRGFRGDQRGRIYAVPQYVVTLEAGQVPAEQVIGATAAILADREHDVLVRIALRAREGDARRARLLDVFGPDPRVRVAAAGDALEEFPAAAFHIALPASAAFAPNLVHRLRTRLRSAVTAAAVLPDGTRVSIARAWALHRARRTGGDPGAYGEARTLSPAALKLKAGAAAWVPGTGSGGLSTPWERLCHRARNLHIRLASRLISRNGGWGGGGGGMA